MNTENIQCEQLYNCSKKRTTIAQSIYRMNVGYCVYLCVYRHMRVYSYMSDGIVGNITMFKQYNKLVYKLVNIYIISSSIYHI